MQLTRTWNSRVSAVNVPARVWLVRALHLIALAILLVGRSAVAQDTGSIQGRVTDSSGAPILGAVVAIHGADGNVHLTVTDVEGAFQMASLQPGNYDLKISASGLSDWTASNVPVSATPKAQPLAVVLQVAPSVTSVTVGLSPQEVAEEQVKSETQQRVLGVIPNYFVAYQDNAAPLSAKEKFSLSFKTLIDPMTFAAVGITAGIQQSRRSYYQFGQGSEGYAKRFGAAYGTTATNLLITSVAAESLFHQDPRYFYSGHGTKKQRAWYAIESAFRSRGDNGKWQPPYAGIAGAIAAAEISDHYYPGSRTQYTLLGRSLMFHFAGLIGLNLGEEFFFKKVTTHKPAEAAAKPPVLSEGTPVTLIAVDDFDGQLPTAGQTVTFVLAQEVTESGKVLASTGDVASGLVNQVNPVSNSGGAGAIALQNVTLRAGNVNVPLRSNQVRGAATPVEYEVLPGSGKIEIKLFVAANVEFPEKE
jgi:hypothetical protein